MKNIYLILVSGCLLLSTGCGTIERRQAEDLGLNPTISPSSLGVFFFATDFISAGQLYSADSVNVGTMANSGLTSLGSSAVVRFFDGLLYVLHDGFSVASSDNVQIIDPSANFETLNQWSTGNGTNPRDLIVIGNKAYISLYNPSQDPENVDGDGHPGDVIFMDLETGEIERRFSFSNQLNNDDDKNARAQGLVLGEDFLYVALQDSQSDFSLNAPGRLGVINLENEAVQGVVILKGRNPVDIEYSLSEKKLYVAHQAPYDFSLGNFDTATAFGGLEIVPEETPLDSVLIDDAELGGYVERLTMASGRIFAVVSEMDPVTFTFTSEIFSMLDDNTSLDGLNVFLSESQDVRDCAGDPSGRLWVARRAITAGEGEATDPRVDVFDIETGEAIGNPMIPLVPVTSIAIGTL